MKRTAFTHRKIIVAGVLAALLLGVAGLFQPAAAQQSNGTPDDQEKAVNYSLYYESFKNEDYETAMPYLRWILAHAPVYPRNDARNFERLIEAYEGFHKQSGDKSYLDSVLIVYDTAPAKIKAAGGEVDEFLWIRDKGRYIQEHPDQYPDRQHEAVAAYWKAYEMDAERLQSYYYQVIIADLIEKDDKDAALEFIDKVEQMKGDDEELQDFLAKARANFIDTDEERIEYLEKKLAKEPEDLAVIQDLFLLYKKTGQKEKSVEIAQRLLQMDPSERVVRTLMSFYSEEGDQGKVAELFKQLESMEGVQLKAEDYYNMGITQQQNGNLQSALGYYNSALEVNSDFRPARVGRLHVYAQAVQRCGSSTGDVYWLLYDMFASAGEGSTAGGYRGAFPTAEQIFYNPNWEVGKSIRVNYSCSGISFGGTTTIRKR